MEEITLIQDIWDQILSHLTVTEVFVLQFVNTDLYELSKTYTNIKFDAKYVCSNNWIELFKWGYVNKFRITNKAAHGAAHCGSIDLIVYMMQNNIIIDSFVKAKAEKHEQQLFVDFVSNLKKEQICLKIMCPVVFFNSHKFDNYIDDNIKAANNNYAYKSYIKYVTKYHNKDIYYVNPDIFLKYAFKHNKIQGRIHDARVENICKYILNHFDIIQNGKYEDILVECIIRLNNCKVLIHIIAKLIDNNQYEFLKNTNYIIRVQSIFLLKKNVFRHLKKIDNIFNVNYDNVWCYAWASEDMNVLRFCFKKNKFIPNLSLALAIKYGNIISTEWFIKKGLKIPINIDIIDHHIHNKNEKMCKIFFQNIDTRLISQIIHSSKYILQLIDTLITLNIDVKINIYALSKILSNNIITSQQYVYIHKNTKHISAFYLLIMPFDETVFNYLCEEYNISDDRYIILKYMMKNIPIKLSDIVWIRKFLKIYDLSEKRKTHIIDTVSNMSPEHNTLMNIHLQENLNIDSINVTTDICLNLMGVRNSMCIKILSKCNITSDAMIPIPEYFGNNVRKWIYGRLNMQPPKNEKIIKIPNNTLIKINTKFSDINNIDKYEDYEKLFE
jgi:hypothetical protein